MSLRSTITLGAATAILVAGLVTFFLNRDMIGIQTRKTAERDLMNVAGIVAQFPEVVIGLRDSPYNGMVQDKVQRIANALQGVDHITVCNMQRIRYSHHNPEYIGLIQEGDDLREVLYQAKRYIGGDDAVGEDGGGVIRAYAPVFDGEEQIGFVIAGSLRERIHGETGRLASSSFVFMLAGLSAGVIGAVLVAHRASRNLLGLEPEEITQVYREHAGLMEAMHEGVVAIDRRGRISFINASARKMLDLGDRNVDGLAIDSIIPTPRLPSIIATGEAEFDCEKRINNKVFIANMVPVLERERVVGAVETFQDRTQIIRMAQELTGIRQLVEALRAASHEFSNKLHVILGLLELGDYDKAKEYVQSTHKDHGKLHIQMLRAFREPMIAGLMLGKYSVAREQGVDLALTPGSRLDCILPISLAHSLVLILGNLVDNAIEATGNRLAAASRILVDIVERDGMIHLRVEDNGPGIAPADRGAIWQRGFSTKGEGRGTGLHLVRQEIRLVGGTIGVISDLSGTAFTATIPVDGGVEG